MDKNKKIYLFLIVSLLLLLIGIAFLLKGCNSQTPETVTGTGEITESVSGTKESHDSESSDKGKENTDNNENVSSGTLTDNPGSDKTVTKNHDNEKPTKNKSTNKNPNKQNSGKEDNSAVTNAPTQESTSTTSRTEIQTPAPNSVFGKFICTRLGINENLYYGDNDYCLHFGVGLSTNSGLPGSGKPSLISGHNSTKFHPLKDVKKGDIFELDLDWGYYKYQIYDIKIMTPGEFDSSILNRKSDDIIVYTCYPFDSDTTATQRIFLYCKPV